MSGSIREVLTFINDRGKPMGRLHLASQSSDALKRVSDAEARQASEEAIQLLEGCTYEYELSDAPPSLRLRESYLTRRSTLRSDGADRGTLRPGLQTGLLPLVLEDADGNEVARAAVEVRSSKLSYREDYRRMLDEVAERTTDLLFELRAPAQTRLTSNASLPPQTLQQQFFFLKGVLASRPFMEAVAQILGFPHVTLQNREAERDIRRGVRSSGRVLRQIASGQPRLSLPKEHPLTERLSAGGMAAPSVPRQLTGMERFESRDTPENRFVKYALQSFEAFLEDVERRLGKDPDFVRREVSPVRRGLSALLERDFFRDIAQPATLPLGSPVLQRKAGYREILQTWLKFNLSAQLSWQGGDDVYTGGKRNVAALYEYWLFFKLLDVVRHEFDLYERPERLLFERTSDGFGLKLKSGEPLSFEGVRRGADTRSLRLQFSYNRTFSSSGKNPEISYPASGSWTRPMRPDYTLSFWPAEFSAAEAELAELMVHIHFDAKYRVDRIKQLFGDDSDQMSDVEPTLEKDQQAEGTYKRDDLLKMHAYRDAIRRTEGAYILYPGDASKIWRGFHELLPGVGAFAMRPGPYEAEDVNALGGFLHGVLEHLSDRATRRERASFHLRHAQQAPVHSSVMVRVPERGEDGGRAMPPAETFVFVGLVMDNAHLAWINNSGFYDVLISDGITSIPLDPHLARASYLVLVGPDGHALPGMWRIIGTGMNLMSGQALQDLGYPALVANNALCCVYKVKVDNFFSGWQWKFVPASEDGSPKVSFVAALDELIRVASIR